MQDEQQPDLIGLSAAIVSAYVAKNHIQTVEISQLIASVHDALRNVAKPARSPSSPSHSHIPEGGCRHWTARFTQPFKSYGC
jgi:predicted transcriptional regulator